MINGKGLRFSSTTKCPDRAVAHIGSELTDTEGCFPGFLKPSGCGDDH